MEADKEKKSKSIEVEVQSKYYRPITSKWFASGVVMVDGRPLYWKAARQYAKWDVQSSAQDGWELGEKQRSEATSLILRALQENREHISRSELAADEDGGRSDTSERISLDHGGGNLMQELIEKTIFKFLPVERKGSLFDGTILPRPSGRLVFTTNTYVIKPVFFKGGDIGSAALYGTVNNVAVCGAKPKAVSLGLVIEEGFPLSVLERILDSVRKASRDTGVRLAGGDTRVVEKGGADGIIINTTGIGNVYPRLRIGYELVRPGDSVLISGNIGHHGIAVISEREGLSFKGNIKSDVGSISGAVEKLIRSKIKVRCMKDPTRGGVASALNQIAGASGKQIEIEESQLPLQDDIKTASEIMGLDPLSLANHGKFLLVCAAADAKKALEKLKSDPCGKNAAIIGRVTDEGAGRVIMKCRSGESRILEMPYSEQMPRVL